MVAATEEEETGVLPVDVFCNFCRSHIQNSFFPLNAMVLFDDGSATNVFSNGAVVFVDSSCFYIPSMLL